MKSLWPALALAAIALALPAARGEDAAQNALKLLPYPKEIARAAGTVDLGPAEYLLPHPSDTVKIAADTLDRYLPKSGKRVAVRLGSVEEGYDEGWLTPDERAFLGEAARSGDAYVLRTAAAGVTVVGKGRWGMDRKSVV